MKLTQSQVRELLHYDPTTGVFTWKHRDAKWFDSAREHRRWNTRFAGKRAGSVWTTKRTGYQSRNIVILGKHYREHRIAWLYMQGHPIPHHLDHENKNATDNRWHNIQDGSGGANQRNVSKLRNNTSGVTGVTWHASSGKWMARCQINGKTHHVGSFHDLNDAAKAVAAFRAANNFNQDHGLKDPHYR